MPAPSALAHHTRLRDVHDRSLARPIRDRWQTLMEYVRFGTAGLQVSRLALGMGLRGQADEAQVERLIHKALDRGINLFDCAKVYA